MKKTLVLLFFLFSGACGLVYEVVWSRLFEFVVGCSHQSMTLVVATFMGGLALGSFLGGRAADRARSPLRLYGALVLFVGASCFAIPALLEFAKPLFGIVYRLHEGEPSHPLFVAVKLAASALILLVPTTLMGATLPALTRHLTRSPGEAGTRLGLLYAANTLGAVAGAWASGFLLIPAVGLWWTSTLAAAIDAGIGAIVLAGARRLEADRPRAVPEGPRPKAAAVPSSPEPIAPPRWVLISVAFGLSGCVDMCLQLGWTRVLILSIGNSTYAFSVIVGIFILGLSAGSAIAASFAGRLRSPQAALGWILAAAAGLSALTIPLFGVFTPEFASWLSRVEGSMTFPRFLLLGALWASALVFPATVFMGMTFPIVARILVRSVDSVGRTIGWAYFANTIGSIIGTLAVGFLILPLAGRLWAPLYLAVAIGLAAGLALVVLDASRPERRSLRLALAGGIAALLVLHGAFTRPCGVLDSSESRRYWNPLTMSIGPYLTARNRQGTTTAEIEEELRGGFDIIYHRDGEAASVVVLKLKGTDAQGLRINGKADASSGKDSPDMPTQLLSGHLPMLARPGARRVLNIGLGSGITLGAMSLYPAVEDLTCLEISPEVLEGARFFEEANHGFFRNPKVRVVIGDGRNHIQYTDGLYDVISSQPSNFWIAGMGNLFTREFYELAKERLAPGGVFCQWLQTYSIRASDFRTALRTLTSAFPHVTLWTPGIDTLFIASREPIEWSRDWIARCLAVPEISGDLKTLGVDHPESVFRYLRLEDPAIRKLAGAGDLNADLFPRLEYAAPLGLFSERFEVPPLIAEAPAEALTAALQGFVQGEAEVYRRQGVLLQQLLAGLDRPPQEADYNRMAGVFVGLTSAKDPWAVKTASRFIGMLIGRAGADPGYILFLRRALHAAQEPELRRTFQSLKNPRVPRELIEAAAKEALSGDWTPFMVLAEEDIARGDAASALRSAAEAAARGAPVPLARQTSGVARAKMGDLDGAEADFLAALAAASEAERGDVLYNLGFLYELKKDWPKGIDHQRRSIAEGTSPARGWTALARCFRASGKPSEALEAARKAMETGKGTAETLREAAMALVELGRSAEAIPLLERAAAADPRYREDLEALKAGKK